MSRATTNEILADCAATYGQDRGHRVGGLSFVGQPGHYYFVPRALSNPELARLTCRSGHAEVTLTRVNDAHIIHIGNRGVATGTFSIPERRDGIELFQWIPHTHPLEQENEYQMIAHGPTQQDRAALRLLFQQWRQTESTVVVCRGGRVAKVAPFQLEPGDIPLRSLGRPIWTPDGH